MSRASSWLETGAKRTRVGWFGLLVREVQMQRLVWRLGSTGWSPENWHHELRWFKAKRGTIVRATAPTRPSRPPPPSHND